MDSSRKMYDQRLEPDCLVIKKGVDYIDVRACQEMTVLESVLVQLDSVGEGAVLIPWSSPPFYITRGYGVYTRSQADELSWLEQEEHWVSRRLSGRFDRQYILRRIKRTSSSRRTTY